MVGLHPRGRVVSQGREMEQGSQIESTTFNAGYNEQADDVSQWIFVLLTYKLHILVL